VHLVLYRQKDFLPRRQDFIWCLLFFHAIPVRFFQTTYVSYGIANIHSIPPKFFKLRSGREAKGRRSFTLGSICSYFEPLVSRQWQVHCHGSSITAIKDLLSEKNIPLYIFEWGPEAKTAGYLKDAIYIVRPDGYIGLADENGDIVKSLHIAISIFFKIN